MANVQEFGEHGGVNPDICDSSTYTFLEPDGMERTFLGQQPGCYLYSRHYNPTCAYLGRLLAAMEDLEDCVVTASGMAAITCALVQLVDPGDEIVASRCIYGGTHTLLERVFPQKFGVSVRFVAPTCLEDFERAITPRTRVFYVETLSNPLLEVAPLDELAALAHRHGIKLMVDNTFAPLLVTPAHHGADVVVHSLTKFINGMSDTIGGAILGSREFIGSLRDLHQGTAMLFGPTMDGLRAASIAKNLRTLHLRIPQHAKNAHYLAERLQESGVPVVYPGLPQYPQRKLLAKLGNTKKYGCGGMLTVDLGSKQMADKLLRALQMQRVGYLAVSLGFYRTLFSAPAASTSSEVDKEEQQSMGLRPGLTRFSVGLDPDIQLSWERFCEAAHEVGFVLRR
jgi:methionine-gamma-lyase